MHHATYLTSGPMLNERVTQATDCRGGSNPSFEDALACAFTSDQLPDDLLYRSEDCSAALSVLQLGARLRQLEETREIQIAKFTRID